MTTLRNKRKLAAVSRETPENTRNSQSQNTLDPEMAQEYISQVSEEIEARVTKKLSKEFSRTVSSILGALSKLDDFLLNPLVRICSVAVPGTSRNSDSENREPTGDPSVNDPCPEVVCSSHHSSNLNGSELEKSHHSSFFVWSATEMVSTNIGWFLFWTNMDPIESVCRVRSWLSTALLTHQLRVGFRDCSEGRCDSPLSI